MKIRETCVSKQKFRVVFVAFKVTTLQREHCPCIEEIQENRCSMLKRFWSVIQ